MHALAFLSLVASTALVAAQDEYASFQPLSTFSTLQARQQQSCASVGGKICGTKCIRLSYTCCGNGAGACEVGYTCGLAANGIYGCCPMGKRCRGDAPDPSTTDIGVARPTTVRGGGAGGAGGVDDDDDDVDETTTTRAVETTTRRLTPTNTPARTTAVSNDDETTTSSSTTTSTTSRSTSTTRSSAVALGTSSSSANGAGSDSNSNSNGNSNGNGSGSSSTAGSGGNGSQASSAGIISVGLASLAGGFIAAIASLL